MNAFITTFPFNIQTQQHSQLTIHPRRNLNHTWIRRNDRPINLFRTIPTATINTQTTKLETFIESARDLGTVRFIAVTNGAVLETIGRFDYSLSTFNVPGRGLYCTLANEDKTFECHMNTSAVHTVTISTEGAKVGDHDIHVIRFLSKEDEIILSSMLMWDPSQGVGHYLHDAVQQFDKLKQKYGSRFHIDSIA